MSEKNRNFAAQIQDKIIMAKNDIVGREHEIQLLEEYLHSDKAELIAVYGRRRIGKTFLIDRIMNGKFDFYMTGIYQGLLTEQMAHFTKQLESYSGKKADKPRNWIDAFSMLQNYLETKSAQDRICVFIDELPWFDTPRSRFLKAFDLFWNSYASKHDNIKLIVCGSATTWMTGKLLGDKGGLHNRVTRPLYLRPFNLHETELFLNSRGFRLDRMQTLDVYMALGGTPFYLDMLRPSLSVAQNIDELFFANDNAPLRKEYDFLFKSLFRDSELYKKVIETLARKMKGLTRNEIVEIAKIESNGHLKEVLDNLCSCDFIRRYAAIGKNQRDMMYQLTDLYSLFSLRFVKGNHTKDPQFWSHSLSDVNPWHGYAFEQVCLLHTEQIRKALGISGILCNVCSWSYRQHVDEDGIIHKGSQVDLVLERGDKTINLCEMKYSKAKYSITKDYLFLMNDRRETFRTVTKTRHNLLLTMITTLGIDHNAAWNDIQGEVTLDDLFKE